MKGDAEWWGKAEAGLLRRSGDGSGRWEPDGGNVVESVPRGAEALDCPTYPEARTPHGNTGLEGYLPPCLELEPDRTLRNRMPQGGPESNQDQCL